MPVHLHMYDNKSTVAMFDVKCLKRVVLSFSILILELFSLLVIIIVG